MIQTDGHPARGLVWPGFARGRPFSGVVPQGVDESRQLRRLVAPAGIVDEVARKRRAPVLEHADEASLREVPGHLLLERERDAYAVERRLHHQVDVEVIPIQKINEAYDRLAKGDVKYRFVIDMASLKSVPEVGLPEREERRSSPRV
jgi:hypothetical protein